jgi:hypothetical protein
MEAIGMGNRVAPIARSPLDSARGRRKYRRVHTSILSIDESNTTMPPNISNKPN